MPTIAPVDEEPGGFETNEEQPFKQNKTFIMVLHCMTNNI